ncbi:MAG: hypothetical protein MJ147_10270 [Clostridia bacterium]|nr:hypothetical protein [Clostridia bacterium]
MKIVNIINFVRACEPRKADDSFLLNTIEEELKLCNKYNFPSTVLLQYDALIKDEYIDVIRKHGKNAEIGLWFEVVEPLAEACNIPWRGRFPWDWHSDVGFLVGYTKDERAMLIDKAFEKFKEILGYYPSVVGSWHIDAFSLRYMSEKYHIVASCNCKDQYGTDGYTMWGGYWNGAYYPSKNNMFCPANSKENQIDVPVFRMLGSDPIHQYDLGLGELQKGQSVMSLEPVYDNSGACRQWVQNFFDIIFNGKGLSLEYTQMGQENSFGWDRISKGLIMQFEELDKRLKESEIQLLTLGDAGRIFSEKFKTTPAAAICADKDTTDENLKTVWYMSKFYRMNILYGDGDFHIRDIYLFRENFHEKYLEETEKTHVCFFSNVPLVDGLRFSDKSKTAGGYFESAGEKISFKDNIESCAENDTVTLKADDKFIIQACPERLVIEGKNSDFTLHFSFVKRDYVSFRILSEKELQITYFEHKECVHLSAGSFSIKGDEFEIIPENQRIIIDFN